MVDALEAALAADEARYRDPVVKSDVVTPAVVGAGGEIAAEPTETKTETAVEADKPVETKVETKPEDDGEKERTKRNRDAESQRWARLTAKLGDAERAQQAKDAEIASLREQLARASKPQEQTEGREQAQPRNDAPMSQVDIDRLVEQRAAAMAADQRRQTETAAFNAECNRVASLGEKEFGDEFQPALQGMFAMAGSPQVSTALIEAALETDTPHAVLYHLGKNPAEVMRLAELKPTKLGAAVAKIAGGLAGKQEAAPQRQEVSRAPAPLEPVSGSGARADAGAMGPRNMSDWIKWDAERSKRL